MASDVEIVNKALSMLGDDLITSLTEDSKRARIANTMFGSNRDAVLRAHPWNCAIARSVLSATTAPEFGWKAKFQLPTDPYCLRVLALNDDEEDGDSGDIFKIEGRTLLTNTGSANIRYIKRVTDPNEYDTMLYDAISARLAAQLAYPITGSMTVAQAMLQIYQGFMKDARTVDGQEGSPDRLDITTLLDVR